MYKASVTQLSCCLQEARRRNDLSPKRPPRTRAHASEERALPQKRPIFRIKQITPTCDY